MQGLDGKRAGNRRRRSRRVSRGVSLSGALLGNDNLFLARSGEQGLVLFTDARPERTAGVIFGLVLQNAIGANTDYFPLGTFRIP